MAQTAITTNPAVAQAGTFATAVSGANQVISKVAAEAIPPGTFVVLTVDDDTTCELPDATGEVTGGRGLGIALIDAQKTAANYAIGEVVQIAIAGEVWVTVEDAVVGGADAFVRFADAATTLGTFRSDADTADAVELPNAIYSSTQASAAGLAKVKLGGVFS